MAPHFLAFGALLASASAGLAVRPCVQQPSRRAVLAGALAFPAAAAFAADGDDLIHVYFGCGCFWHVQHEMVEAERRILGRSDVG